MRPLIISITIVAVVSCGSKQPKDTTSPSRDTVTSNGEIKEPVQPPLVIVPRDDELQVLEAGGELVARLPVIEVQSALAVSPDGRAHV